MDLPEHVCVTEKLLVAGFFFPLSVKRRSFVSVSHIRVYPSHI